MNTPVQEFKVLVVGDPGVGKSTYLSAYLSEELQAGYFESEGVRVYPILLHTNRGTIRLSLWQIQNQQMGENLQESYYIGAHAAIMMFDVTTRESYRSIPQWYRDIISICQQIPIILVGNKVDMKERKVKSRQITFHRKKNLMYYDLSAKYNYNYEKPFLFLLKRLFNDINLSFTKKLHVRAPEGLMNETQKNYVENELHQANNMFLPSDDDDI